MLPFVYRKHSQPFITISVGARIYYILATVQDATLEMIDLSQVPPAPIQVDKFVGSNMGFLLCPALDKYIYLFSEKLSKRHDVATGKSVDISVPLAGGTLCSKPIVFQDRYLVIIKGVLDWLNYTKEWRVLMLDILDESAGWMDVGIIKSEHNLRPFSDLFYERHGRLSVSLVKGSNQSLLYTGIGKETLEFFINPNKEPKVVVLDNTCQKDIEILDVVTPVNYKGHAWMLEKRGKELIAFSYAEKKYKILNSTKGQRTTELPKKKQQTFQKYDQFNVNIIDVLNFNEVVMVQNEQKQ
eukprot:TRINITY_DN558_c0_g1_i3.p2 TRINITY_DN558_c0_g1~~TRINITY_DN558_c0_g1_i3.p2  ORF type:complete len:298 (+),score=5.98 TRINITY_DN558_c0_g1_i3:1090-1983(+)